MAVANLTYPRFKAFKAGKVLSGGKVYVYEAGTTTKTTIWKDQNKNSTHSNPVTLDSNGEAEIWFEGPVKVVLEDSSGTQQWTIDDVQSDIPPSDVGRFNVLENGSFELDANGDNLPDDWTITEDDSTSTVEIDTTNVSHGANSLKFVSQGSGGGTATTSNFFEVNAGKTCVVAFTIKSSVADVQNQVQVRYHDKDQTFISSDTVYNENSSNPTSFTEKRFVSSVPATATYAKLRLVGCDASDPTSGTTYYDDIKVFTDQQAAVYSDDSNVWQFSGTGGNVTATAAELNKTDGLTATTAELNKLDGATVTTAEINILDGVTASTANINNIDGLTVDISGINAHPFNQSDIAASAIGQGELKTTTGSVSHTETLADTSSTVDRTLPGGLYGFYAQSEAIENPSGGSTGSIQFLNQSVTTGWSTNVSLTATTSGTEDMVVSARHTYIQASPPYDLGDGECGLFIEADIDSAGVVRGLYVAPDPVWANNGPTNIRPDYIDKNTGKKYKRIRRPAVTREDVLVGRADTADRVAALKEAPVEDVEITMAYKNADMDLFPHSWLTPPQGTIVMLDPVNTHDLLMLHDEGEDVAELMHKGYVQIGDEVRRKGPPGVVPVTFKWRNTKK